MDSFSLAEETVVFYLRIVERAGVLAWRGRRNDGDVLLWVGRPVGRSERQPLVGAGVRRVKGHLDLVNPLVFVA